MKTLQAVALVAWVGTGLLLLVAGASLVTSGAIWGLMCMGAEVWPGGMRCEWVPDND